METIESSAEAIPESKVVINPQVNSERESENKREPTETSSLIPRSNSEQEPNSEGQEPRPLYEKILSYFTCDNIIIFVLLWLFFNFTFGSIIEEMVIKYFTVTEWVAKVVSGF